MCYKYIIYIYIDVPIVMSHELSMQELKQLSLKECKAAVWTSRSTESNAVQQALRCSAGNDPLEV